MTIMTIMPVATDATSWGTPVQHDKARTTTIRPPRPDVALPAAGVVVSAATWAGAAGATSVAVTSAGFSISGPSDATTLQSVVVTAGDGGFIVNIPPGFVVRSLRLDGLKADSTTISSSADLSADRRLVVTLPAPQGDGFGPPVYAVPGVPKNNAVPATLGGASFDHGVLSLPDVAATRLLLTITDGDNPDEFTTVPDPELASVTALLVPVPADLLAQDDTGTTTWSRPGPLTSVVDVDLATASERTLAAALAAGAPLSSKFVVTSAKPTTVGLRDQPPRGELVRAVAGTVKAELTGDPVRLDLGAAAVPLAPERPGSVTAHLIWHYQGVRLSETIDDPVPEAGTSDAVRGVVVGAEPVTRTLPPAALVGQDVVRIGVIGRAPVDAALSVQLWDPVNHAPLGPPGISRVPAGGAFSTVWLALPSPARPSGPVSIALSATEGRFLWATGSSPGLSGPVPLVRVAVADPDPGGRPVHLAGAELGRVTRAAAPAPAGPAGAPAPTTIDPAAFTGPDAPLLDSALFVTVELSSLTLHYPR